MFKQSAARTGKLWRARVFVLKDGSMIGPREQRNFIDSMMVEGTITNNCNVSWAFVGSSFTNQTKAHTPWITNMAYQS